MAGTTITARTKSWSLWLQHRQPSRSEEMTGNRGNGLTSRDKHGGVKPNTAGGGGSGGMASGYYL
ncbi:hypothetical protein E2C01_040263 [Portunus trituberculatus]|uniref:Uncharacterized protein n=1 Tax=Portunus trituberculatus TaxID=210409 RepID=A0A5B7FNB2_PORTR|nr:hypothetical protein [Portunus trituberculatus]